MKNERLERARLSLEGLSVGDAFGECFFFSPDLVFKLIKAGVIPGSPFEEELIEEFMMFQVTSLREVPANPPWKWTDDTAMAIAIYEALREGESIDQSTLSRTFGLRYLSEPARGYGAAMHTLLPELARGADWQRAAAGLFGGEGSYGNGAAMRVAPIGAYFADDLPAVIENARRSAEITHSHSEGVAGAIAVAIGAALAWQYRESIPASSEFLELVLPHLPVSVVRSEIEVARDLAPLDELTIDEVVEALGNGEEVTAQDTVPFVLWAASHYLGNYEEALWLTVSARGDRDTTCAMVGGIVALSSQTPIPAGWIQNREALPEL